MKSLTFALLVVGFSGWVECAKPNIVSQAPQIRSHVALCTVVWLHNLQFAFALCNPTVEYVEYTGCREQSYEQSSNALPAVAELPNPS